MPTGEPEQEIPPVQETQEVDVPTGEPEQEIPPAQEAQEPQEVGGPSGEPEQEIPPAQKVEKPQEVEGPFGETSDIRPKQPIHPDLQIPAGSVLIVESAATLVTQCSSMPQSMQQESQDVD